MFETYIGEAARDGIRLHNREGGTYWKLLLTCSKDGCDKEVDMGECLCFETEEEMVRCRDGHELYCSHEHWYECATREAIEDFLGDIRRHNEIVTAAGDDELYIDGESELELLVAYFDYLADAGYEGFSLWEAFEIEECPI